MSTGPRSESPPFGGRDDDSVHGHLLLARLGKRVHRPGGLELTRVLLADARLTDADVVELAPGLGRTASEIVAGRPRSYRGVDRDPQAVRAVRPIVAGYGDVRVADATHTGLGAASADIVIGEAILTMQSDRNKHAIVDEAVRLLRPGGRLTVHELGLTREDLPEDVKAAIRQELARSTKVNARPLTRTEWTSLLALHGLVIEHVRTSRMALLQSRRLLADEGPAGALRFVWNLLTHPRARRRVLAMRRTFRSHSDHLTAIAMTARKPSTSENHE